MHVRNANSSAERVDLVTEVPEPRPIPRTVRSTRKVAARRPVVYRETPAKRDPVPPAQPVPAARTLGDAFKNRHNNLLLVRLLLSLVVVVSHSIALANGPQPGDWLKRTTAAYWNHAGIAPGITIGFSAVNLFFVVSGFLVTHSFIRSGSIGEFASKRFWRIWPAYCIAALMCLLVIGPLALHAWPAVPYAQWPRFLLDVLFLRIYEIDGAFTDAPYSGALNGSMWTIKYEVMCYVFIAFAWSVGLLRRRHLLGALFALVAGYYGLQVAGVLEQWNLAPWLPRPVAFIVGEAREWPRILTCYLAGMTLYAYRDSIPQRWWLACAAVAVLVGCGLVAAWLLLPLIPLLLGYAVLSAGFTTVGRRFTRRLDTLDVSYGVYLYAFPVQQTIVHFLPIVRGSPLLLFALAYPTVLLLAWASMRYIERRFQFEAPKKAGEPVLPMHATTAL